MKSYSDQLAAVLRARDPDALRSFLVESARAYGDDAQVKQITGQSDQDIEALMHRMIVARRDLTDLHEASRRWLEREGLAGGPLRPPSGGARDQP